MASLHWLPIQTRADFKVLLLTYKALNGFEWTDLLIPYISQRSLCSLNSRLLVIPSVNKKTTGCRAFSYRAFSWNQLPLDVKEGNSSTVFKYRLKINFFLLSTGRLFYLFCKVY